MPDGDGGEAGDGSDSGDEELAELSSSEQAPSAHPTDLLHSRLCAATEGTCVSSH